ncbi:MAG: efflux transporter outer membrane subunit [Rhizobiales bacterium]|nr:efflux transporter outer membrane subunit [Hyphomicrobiales bacterium]
MPKMSTLVWALGVAFIVSGCVTREQPRGLALALPGQWQNGPTATPRRPAPDLSAWWKAFRDPAIDRLVADALARNPGVEEAMERVNAARALARAQGSQRFPGLDASAQARIDHRLSGAADGLNAGGESLGQGPLRTVGLFQSGFDARWEVDLFGRVRSGIAGAERAAEVAQEERDDVKVTLVAEIVRTYLELRAAERRRAVIADEIAARRGLLDLVRTQQTAGSSGDFDVQRARATFEAARARLPAAELAERIALQRLATLAGSARADARLHGANRGVPVIAAPRAPIPADLLRWRPDIRRAERLVAQRGFEADIAYADLFPRLTLVGSLDVRGNLIGQPVMGTPVTISGGPGVTIPLLDWGLRRQVLSAREAQWREAIAAYRGSVLRGVEDVEIALATIRTSAMRLERQRTAVAAAQRASTTADRLYRGGLTGLTERLQAETDLRQAELDLADATESAAIAPVSLFKAIGAPNTAPSPPVDVLAEPPAPVSWAAAPAVTAAEQQN